MKSTDATSELYQAFKSLLYFNYNIDTLRKGLENVNVHTRSHFELSWDLISFKMGKYKTRIADQRICGSRIKIFVEKKNLDS